MVLLRFPWVFLVSLREIQTAALPVKFAAQAMEGSSRWGRSMGYPQARWMVYFMKNPFINGWFRGTPILGHLHIYIYHISFVIVSIHSMSSLYLEYIWTFISRKILCCVIRNWYLGHWVLLGDALSPMPQRQDVKTTPGVSARHCGGALGPFGEYRNGSGRPGNRWGICCLAIVFCLISRCCSHKSLVA